MYKTELMQEILQSPMAQKIIQEVSPIYGEAYTALWLYEVIGRVLDTMDEWTGSLELQVVPQTATWALPYWEEQYSIIPEPTWNNERRRQNIVNKRRSRVPINPHNLEKIASVAAGVDTRVVENTGKNRFTVYISARKANVNEDYVKQEINKAKPAHLIFDIVYEQYSEAIAYFGGTIQTAKEITINQI